MVFYLLLDFVIAASSFLFFKQTSLKPLSEPRLHTTLQGLSHQSSLVIPPGNKNRVLLLRNSVPGLAKMLTGILAQLKNLLTPGWGLGTFCRKTGSRGGRGVTTATPAAPLYRITDCRRLSQINPTYLNHWPRKPQQKIHSEDVLNMTCIPLYFEMWNEYPKLISIKH